MTPSVQKHIGGKTCATDESELSMVHEGSSERIEQENIMIDFIWVCIARSMVKHFRLLDQCNGLRA